MRKKIRFAITSLSVLILVGIVSACNDNSNQTLKKDDSANKDSSIQVEGTKIEPPVTITTVWGEDPTVKFKNGESYSDNVHTRWAKETLGVEIKTDWTSPMGDGSYDTKLKLMLSSGSEIPDIFISTQPATTNLFIESGKVLDVTQAFQDYASSTYKKAMDDAPGVWQPFTRGDKKFAIPILRPSMGSQSPLWIRQDWLDKLGLKPPTTVEEFEEVMDAFVNQDPDGNGVKDTVALDLAIKDGLIGSPIGDSSWVFGMFGAIPEIWYPDKEGNLKYGSIQPEIKGALAKLKDWMDKGYIANDIALHDFNKVAENVAAGKVGMLGGQNWLASYPGALLTASDPNAKYMPYPLPKGTDGKNMRTVDTNYVGAILINKDISNQSLQAFFHYMNYMYGVYDQEDPLYFKAFQDGYDYVIKDGEIVTEESQIPGGKIETMKYTLVGNQIVIPTIDLEKTKRLANGEPPTNSDRVTSAPLGNIAEKLDPSNSIAEIIAGATLVASSQQDVDVPNYFQGPITKTMSSRNELLKKMQMDAYTSIIYGKQPLEYFDEFTQKWNSSGGDQITKEVNEWYDSIEESK